MGSLLALSSLCSQPFPLLSLHHEYPVIEGILRMGNGKLCPDAVKAPISALQRVIHVFNQVLAPGILRVCPFHPKILSAFAYFQMRSVKFLPVGILISHSKTLPVFFRAIRMVSQTLQSISFLSKQKLLKHYLIFTFIITFFLVSNLPPLYNLFGALFHHLQTLTQHCTAT